MNQEKPGGARLGQEPGGAERSQEEPGGARRSQEEPGGARKSQEEPQLAGLKDANLTKAGPVYLQSCLDGFSDKVHTAGGWYMEIGSLSKCRGYFAKNPLRLNVLLR